MQDRAIPGLLPPAPEILPEALPTEGAARIALLIVIGGGVAALLLDVILSRRR